MAEFQLIYVDLKCPIFLVRRHFVEALMARLDLNAHCDSVTGCCKQK